VPPNKKDFGGDYTLGIFCPTGFVAYIKINRIKSLSKSRTLVFGEVGGAVVGVCAKKVKLKKQLIEEALTMSEIKYEIIKKIGVLSKSTSGWAKELNVISWNDRDPKYDLRDWSADGGKMGKGVTLSKEELLALKELLNTLEL